MLVLSRLKDEVIVAGTYFLTVVEIGEDVVRLRLERQLWKHKARRLCQFWAAVDEPFDIGSELEGIVGKVTLIDGDRVKIGIEADRDKVPVDRLEVRKRMTTHVNSRQISGRRLPPPDATVLPPARRRHEQATHHAQ